LIWGFGVPTLILGFLFRRKKHFKSSRMKMRFGFKKSRVYWEFVHTYRRLILICCVVFIGSFSIKAKVLTIMAILAFSLILHHFVGPYSHPTSTQP
jgi:hypothetical protein